MKKTALILLAGVLAFVLVMPDHASASWSQSLHENGLWGTPAKPYKLTKYEGFIVSDPAKTQWEGLGLTPQNSNWTTKIVNPTYSVMSGPATGSLDFSAFFSGKKYQGFTWNVVAWVGDTIIGAEKISFGTNFSYQELNIKDKAVMSMITNYNRSPVPLPGSYLLLASGLIGLIGIQRKKLLPE